MSTKERESIQTETLWALLSCGDEVSELSHLFSDPVPQYQACFYYVSAPLLCNSCRFSSQPPAQALALSLACSQGQESVLCVLAVLDNPF